MAIPGELWRRLRMLLQRSRFQNDLDEEIRLHLYLREQELRQQQHLEEGIALSPARSAALKRFGNPTRVKEKSYMTWGWQWLESFMQDVRYGVRSLFRSPGLMAAAILSLGLGIGANTAIFSFLDAVMLRSLPVKDPAQLVLFGTNSSHGITDSYAPTEIYSYPFYRRMQAENSVFSSMSAIMSLTNDVHGAVDNQTETEPMQVQLVSGTYFSMLGVPPRLGRVLTDQDDSSQDDHPVAVVSDSWWNKRFARDPNILGRKIKLGATSFEIVGVAAPEFFGTSVGDSPNVWIPLSMMTEVPPGFGGYKDVNISSLQLLGRLKPGVTLEQATQNVNLLFRTLHTTSGEKPGPHDQQDFQKARVPLTSIESGLSSIRGQYSGPLQILMILVVLVLLIACANVANLLLARSTARAREFAVRQAIGAGRLRLVRQLLTESLLLAFAGGAVGIALAYGANRVLLRMISNGRAEAVPLDVHLSGRILLFTLAVTVVTAIFFGTLPALRATKTELSGTLKDGRGASGSTGFVAKFLIVMQVAFSLVLLVGSGLFLRSLIGLTKIETGFNKENVLRLQTDASSAGYKQEDPRIAVLYRDIEDRIASIHNVTAVSYSSFTFHEGSWNGGITVPGMPEVRGQNVKHNIVGYGYFKTMQIPLIAGRTFGPQDTATSQKVAIISELTARTRFPAGDILGHPYNLSGTDVIVVGIARDVKFNSLTEKPDQVDYIPLTQHPDYLNDIEVRYTGDFATISTSVQQAIHSVDRNLPITRVTTLDEQVARSYTQQSTVAELSVCFGLLAVILSAIGIYGLLSYTVNLRVNEIGIRMALGAGRGNVRWLVMREIVTMVAYGVALGVPATIAGGRLIANLLFGLKGTDATSLLAATAILLLVAMLAGFLPARRASSVDPMRALRYE